MKSRGKTFCLYDNHKIAQLHSQKDWLWCQGWRFLSVNIWEWENNWKCTFPWGISANLHLKDLNSGYSDHFLRLHPHLIYIYIYIYIYSVMVIVIGNTHTHTHTQWSGRPGFNPVSSHTKESKMILDGSLLNAQHDKYGSRVSGAILGKE